MGKKKRQSDPDMDEDNDSTESCDENQNAPSCPHIVKAVDLTRIRKALAHGLSAECQQCAAEPQANGTIEDDYEYDISLWLCLRCGNQSCGRSKRKHALEHFSKPRSDCHALCVNTTMWDVWCYVCDVSVMPNTKKKLLEAVEWVRKQAGVNNVRPPIALTYYDTYIADALEVTTSPKLGLPGVRGLYNLGNTCFFNAVLQCLAQTPFLQSVLKELSVEGERFVLPGGKTPIDQTVRELPPLDGALSGWGPLTEALYTTLEELTSGLTDVFVPRSLLSQLTQRQPLFGGGNQHDSHELLRNLLEVVRSEDLRRYQLVILERLGFSGKTNPNSVKGCTKQIIKFYGQQASDLMIRTDQVFRGVLVSTLQCQDCKHSSHRDEYFLDLSLPVTGEKQMPPSLRRKSDAEPMEQDKPSKYQMKKEKRAARKARKHQHKSTAGNSTITEEQPDNKSESEESDADVEDNVEDCRSPGGCEDLGKGLESGYNSEKISDASPEMNALEIDSGVTSPLTVNVASPICGDADSPNSGSSEANIELASPQFPSMSPEDYERPISRLSFAEKPTILTVEDKSQSMLDSGDTILEPLLSNSSWGATVSARYQCGEGECSVQSCLNQFTSCELMTGNNRVRCDNCTKNITGDDNKAVYTNATKQLLISSPPAILILHLKRFQVSRCFPRKMCKHVTFPLVLDMAPFCSNRCRDLPSFDGHQSKLLYSLYGIVEHSGTLHGGHYVAYVKVRPQIPVESYRWQFLAKPNAPDRMDGDEIGAQGEMGAHGDPAPPPGKWYYVSDSFVTEIPESKVLKAQAYLLFYERIL